MKSKIEVGQCYENDDHVYLVIGRSQRHKNKWVIQNTLTRNLKALSAKELINWHRPFQNFG